MTLRSDVRFSRRKIVGLGITSIAASMVSSACCHALEPPPSAKGVQHVRNFKGINLSGAEFNSGPGKRLHKDYEYPAAAEIDYFAAKGFGAIRLPFDGARLYTNALGPINPSELRQIVSVAAHCASKGLRCILDPHNYGKVWDSATTNWLPVGTENRSVSLFADMWARLAQGFKDWPNVVFGLMNEPSVQSAEQWKKGAVAAVNAIRNAGAKQLILIPGVGYTAAHRWIANGNGAAWDNFEDTNFAFDMHAYLDNDNSGTHAACAQGSGASRLLEATAWCRRNKFRAFLGEFAWSVEPSCPEEAKALLDYMKANADVWIGWAVWAGGPWWPDSYMFKVTPPKLNNPVDTPQLKLLLNYL